MMWIWFFEAVKAILKNIWHAAIFSAVQHIIFVIIDCTYAHAGGYVLEKVFSVLLLTICKGSSASFYFLGCVFGHYSFGWAVLEFKGCKIYIHFPLQHLKFFNFIMKFVDLIVNMWYFFLIDVGKLIIGGDLFLYFREATWRSNFILLLSKSWLGNSLIKMFWELIFMGTSFLVEVIAASACSHLPGVTSMGVLIALVIVFMSGSVVRVIDLFFLNNFGLL